MPDKRESSSLNANATEFVPFAVQQSQQSQQHVAQRVSHGQSRQSPTESISAAYGYPTGAIAPEYSPCRRNSSQVRPAVSGTRGGSLGPMNAISAHAFTRDNCLHNLHASNLPIDARPGTTRFQITGYSHHENSFAPSSVPDNLDAASARLLSIRYGFSPNNPSFSAAQLPATGHSDSFLPRPLERATSHQSSGSLTGMRLGKRNQHEAFDITRTSGPRKSAETSTTREGPTQDSSDDEDDYEDGPDEAIWTKTSYIGPKMPKKYSLDDVIKFDENGTEIPWEDKPLPPPFPYQKRLLAPKPSTQGRIPLYGVLAGMQYDHNSKLYYGDGLPRPTPFRPDGTGPCTPSQARNTQVGSTSVDTRASPNDNFHLQPMLEVRDNLLNFGVHGIATMRLCRCINMWGPESAMTEHVCPAPSIENRVRATPVSTKKVYSVDRVPGLEPGFHHDKCEWTQAEKKMHATNNVGVTMGAGDSDRTGVEVCEFSDFFVDGGGEKGFTGPVIQDFGAKIKGKAGTSISL